MRTCVTIFLTFFSAEYTVVEKAVMRGAMQELSSFVSSRNLEPLAEAFSAVRECVAPRVVDAVISDSIFKWIITRCTNLSNEIQILSRNVSYHKLHI